ncbi:coiled-coil domain-containing protein 174-like isoform X2 [Sycon ciliatum]|uniref:coiled-coil domain-containing protein 174-like isoform X2 n=1 Tax=Sycon ciliatum TaxID=27933 RepID=UPI0031F6F81C
MADSPANQINSSSMVDLKAVLFSTASAVKRAKATGIAPAKEDLRSKKAIWAKRNSGIDKRNAKDVAETAVVSMEEEDMLAKSKAILHQKAALYEKLSKVGHQDDTEEGFLVDFEKKSYDNEAPATVGETSKGAGKVAGDGNDWVDYVDSLGRSRRCLRKDLPDLKAMDADLSGRPEGATTAAADEPDAKKAASSALLPWLKEDATLMSEDMYKELRRQKWEEQERELAERTGPVHFEDIRFNEAREMGVGYYQFSTDETERQEQMEQLQTLRNQTLEQRKRHHQLKDRRRLAMEARLQKVKARRAKRLGVELTEEGELDAEAELKQEIAERKSAEIDDAELAARTADEIAESRRLEEQRREAATLEWERGLKDRSTTKPAGAEDDERDEEFAPPSAYAPPRSRPKSATIASHSSRSLADLSVKAKKSARTFSDVLKQLAEENKAQPVPSVKKNADSGKEPCGPSETEQAPTSQACAHGSPPSAETAASHTVAQNEGDTAQSGARSGSRATPAASVPERDCQTTRHSVPPQHSQQPSPSMPYPSSGTWQPPTASPHYYPQPGAGNSAQFQNSQGPSAHAQMPPASSAHMQNGSMLTPGIPAMPAHQPAPMLQQSPAANSHLHPQSSNCPPALNSYPYAGPTQHAQQTTGPHAQWQPAQSARPDTMTQPPQNWPGAQQPAPPQNWPGPPQPAPPQNWPGPPQPAPPQNWPGAQQPAHAQNWPGLQQPGPPQNWPGPPQPAPPQNWPGPQQAMPQHHGPVPWSHAQPPLDAAAATSDSDREQHVQNAVDQFLAECR